MFTFGHKTKLRRVTNLDKPGCGQTESERVGSEVQAYLSVRMLCDFNPSVTSFQTWAITHGDAWHGKHMSKASA